MTDLVEIQPLRVMEPTVQTYPIAAVPPQPAIQYVQMQPAVNAEYDDRVERTLSKVAAFVLGAGCLVGVGYAIAPKVPAPSATPVPTPSTPPVVIIDGGKGKGCLSFCFGGQ